jgi:hypothetical protein
MDWMPDALPTIDPAGPGCLMPSEVGGAAIVAYPLRPELKRQAIAASLDDDFVPLRRFPEFLVQTVARGARSG